MKKEARLEWKLLLIVVNIKTHKSAFTKKTYDNHLFRFRVGASLTLRLSRPA